MLPHPDVRNPTAAPRRTSRPLHGSGPWRSWRAAWTEAAYGPDGFWSRERPADHFATGVGAGPLVARAVAGLVPPEVGVVVDVGAGDAALLRHLVDLLPGVALVGVDRRPRPDGLDPRVRWSVDHWDVDAERWARGGPEAWLAGLHEQPRPPLLVAHEWLDDLPTTVAVRAADD